MVLFLLMLFVGLMVVTLLPMLQVVLSIFSEIVLLAEALLLFVVEEALSQLTICFHGTGVLVMV